MINRRLTSGEAARQLGVKPATLYSYVSRGLLARQRTPSGSTFDAQEVARLARTGRRGATESAADGLGSAGGGGDGGGWRPLAAERQRRAGGDPVFVTELTLIQSGRLYYRGLDAVSLSRSRSFEEVTGWLWNGSWPQRDERWATPTDAAKAVAKALRGAGPDALPVERWMVAVTAAALTDDLRHDLSRAAIPIVGGSLISTLVDALPVVGASAGSGVTAESGASTESISARLWSRLSTLPLTPARQSVLESALVLSADHELAPSTLAARVAAAFRADPYAVVSTGFGPASGSWYSGSSGAPGEVEALLQEAEAGEAGRAIGERLRRTGSAVHGFGMPLYPDGDPRGAELLRRIGELGGARSDGVRARLGVVRSVLDVGRARGFAPPNVDLGLGALAFCAHMIPGAGQAIATLGKVAGWLAHAMEEYAEPTRFRTRAAYIGLAPG